MSITEKDKIGREEIVDKICGLVDSLKKEDNFCLAINGAWGSGKSFVLSMIEEKLSQKSEYIVVKYDAWENSFYPDPLIAILYCILDGLEDKLSKMRGYGKVAADFGKKKGKEIVDKLSESGGKIGFIAKIIKDIFEVIPDLKNVSLVSDTKNNQLEIFKSYKSLLNQIKELLNKLTEKVFVSNEQTKLVILVDEIDRCLPDEQLKVLERLHHLFDVKNCAVIVAMNQACIAQTVRTTYGIDGYEYLRKFFDFTYRLRISANEYLKKLFDEYTEQISKFQDTTDDIKSSVDFAYKCLLYGNKKVLDSVDNREIFRYCNNVYALSQKFGWDKINAEYAFFILIALYIKRIISPTFLNDNELARKQDERNAELSHVDYPDSQSPFYDYLAEHLGVERRNPPEELRRICRSNPGSLCKFLQIFNEIVYCSVKLELLSTEIPENIEKPDNKLFDDCKELCRLVILYGGEQEKCER